MSSSARCIERTHPSHSISGVCQTTSFRFTAQLYRAGVVSVIGFPARQAQGELEVGANLQRDADGLVGQVLDAVGAPCGVVPRLPTRVYLRGRVAPQRQQAAQVARNRRNQRGALRFRNALPDPSSASLRDRNRDGLQ
jgi:hypothetical protein